MTIEVKHRGGSQAGVTVRVGEQELVVDITPAAGGDYAAASPHDLYDAALGACKVMTVLFYAQRKGIPVEDVAVVVDRDASGERDGEYRLDTRVRIKGELTEDQLRVLEDVAHRCPIHKLMTIVKTTITTRLVRM